MKHKKFDEYAKKIAKEFNIPKKLLFMKNKKRELVDARHILYLVCFKKDFQLATIERLMFSYGYKINHPSIIHGIKKMNEKIKEDADYKQLIEDICTN